jgi:hypothetical protein
VAASAESAAHAGERARRTGLFHCGRCGATVQVAEGAEIPPCPDGHTEYKKRMQDPGRQR